MLSAGATGKNLNLSSGQSSLDFAQFETPKCWCWPLLAILAWTPWDLGAAEQPLYVTDFSDFTAGEDQLIGNGGRYGNHAGQGIHGIDANACDGEGNTAFLGFISPELGSDN